MDSELTTDQLTQLAAGMGEYASLASQMLRAKRREAELLTAVRVAYEVMINRLYHGDANPQGVVDLLGSAIAGTAQVSRQDENAQRVSELEDALQSMLIAFDAPHIPTKHLADTSAIKKARIVMERVRKAGTKPWVAYFKGEYIGSYSTPEEADNAKQVAKRNAGDAA